MESEEKYRNLFMNMTEEVHLWRTIRDEQGRIETWRLVDANPPTLKTWSRTLEEIKGKTTDRDLRSWSDGTLHAGRAEDHG